MDLQLKNRVVVVTGGAKGIGEGISRVLAAEGARVAIVGRNASDNLSLAQEIRQAGGQAFAFQAELTEPEACEKTIREVVSTLGSIYGLVNNAGLNDGVGLENGNYERFMQSMHNNLVHYYLMAHFALPELIKSRGAIVNITSKSAETGQGGTSAYAAANGGRNALTREWAVELLKYQIRVNAVVVSECWTPQYANWILKFPDSEARLEEIRSRIPLGNRMTTIEEIGYSTAFLLSERSSHTTGQLIHVDGGYVHLDRALRNEK
jgi:L-fucose dehydrogenase